MKKVNNQALMEVIADLMSDNSITFRQFSNHFFDSRVHNKDSFLKTLELLKTDIKNKRVVDSKNNHIDLIEEFCNE